MPNLANVVRVAALGASKKKALAAKARAAIALIKDKKDEIARDFYAIGAALIVLDDKGVIASLGHTSFGELCDVELAMSAAQAARLMNVVKSFSKREAEHLTAAKATAIIDLAGAIGGKTTARGLLSRGTVHVPGVGAIDVRGAGAAAIARAARTARSKAPRETKRGVSVSSADRATIAHVKREMKRVKGATIEAIAASATTGSRFRVTGFLRDAHAIGEALARAAKKR